MVIVNSCFRDFMEFSSNTIKPPPSTVSTVRHNRLGVNASKSYNQTHIHIMRIGLLHLITAKAAWNAVNRTDTSQRVLSGCYLKHTHAISASQDLTRVFVVTPSDASGRYKELEGVIAVWIEESSCNQLLDLLHALLLMSEMMFNSVSSMASTAKYNKEHSTIQHNFR